MTASAICGVNNGSSHCAITDTYEYDAFGNKINSTGTTPNNYLYRGEQFDPDLGLYYLHARYCIPITGRFPSRDLEDGLLTDLATLHKYSYAGGDPVNKTDPSGRAAKAGTMGEPRGEYVGLTTFVMQMVEAAAPVIVVAETCALLYEVTSTLAEVSGGPFAQIVPGTVPCTVKAKKNKCTLGGVSGTVVIGEDMNRVKPFAEAHGAGFYDAPRGPAFLYLNNNMEWIIEVMDEGCIIWDGGPMPDRKNYPSPTSPYYFQEKSLIGLHGYPTEPVFIPPVLVN